MCKRPLFQCASTRCALIVFKPMTQTHKPTIMQSKACIYRGSDIFCATRPFGLNATKVRFRAG